MVSWSTMTGILGSGWNINLSSPSGLTLPFHPDPNMPVMVLPDIIWSFQVLNRVPYTICDKLKHQKGVWKHFFFLEWILNAKKKEKNSKEIVQVHIFQGRGNWVRSSLRIQILLWKREVNQKEVGHLMPIVSHKISSSSPFNHFINMHLKLIQVQYCYFFPFYYPFKKCVK